MVSVTLHSIRTITSLSTTHCGQTHNYKQNKHICCTILYPRVLVSTDNTSVWRLVRGDDHTIIHYIPSRAHAFYEILFLRTDDSSKIAVSIQKKIRRVCYYIYLHCTYFIRSAQVHTSMCVWTQQYILLLYTFDVGHNVYDNSVFRGMLNSEIVWARAAGIKELHFFCKPTSICK